MWMLFIVWTLFALPVLALTFWAYRVTARNNRIAAAVLAVLMLSVSILIWPIPIHGGFTIVAEVIYDEWRSQLRLRERALTARTKSDFERQRAQRFSGPLLYDIDQPLSNGWVVVVFGEGARAWLDERSHLIWAKSLELESTDTLPSLATAKQRCEQQSPKGKWALATEAEHVFRWQHKGDDFIGKSPYSVVSYIYDESLPAEFPTYALTQKFTEGQSRTRAKFAVNCVAITADAPAAGYEKRDIPLELWNAYQLSKMTR